MNADSILEAMQRARRERARAGATGNQDARPARRNVQPVNRESALGRSERQAAAPRDDGSSHRHGSIGVSNDTSHNDDNDNHHHGSHGAVPGHQKQDDGPGWLTRLWRQTWGAFGWQTKGFLTALCLACGRYPKMRGTLLWLLAECWFFACQWILEMASGEAGPHVHQHPAVLNTTTTALVFGGRIPETCVSAVAVSMPDMIDQLAAGGGGLAGTSLEAYKVARGRAACEAAGQVLGSARTVASGVERRVEGVREDIAALYTEVASHTWRLRWRAAFGIARPNVALVMTWVARFEEIAAAMTRELDVLLAAEESSWEDAPRDGVGSVSVSVGKISDVMEQTCVFSNDVGQHLRRISGGVGAPSHAGGGDSYHDWDLVDLVAMDGAASGIHMACRVVHGVYADQQQLVTKLKRERQFQVRALSSRIQSIRASIREDNDEGSRGLAGAQDEMALARQYQGQLLQAMDRLNAELGALYYVEDAGLEARVR